MTGALGAISEFMIKSVKAAGAKLVLTDKVPEAEALEMLEEWGITDATYFSMDVTKPNEVETVVATAFELHPEINIALGHAGGTGIFHFSECDQKTFDQLVAFNFLGQTYFCREVLKHWVEKETPGQLIFTSSYVSKIPMAGISAYVASKAALEMFAKNIALEYADKGIRVNCVSPGNVAIGSSLKVYETDDTYRAWVDRVSPLGKRNSPQAIANAFLYLCSELGDELDGHVLQVDMGVGLPKLG